MKRVAAIVLVALAAAPAAAQDRSYALERVMAAYRQQIRFLTVPATPLPIAYLERGPAVDRKPLLQQALDRAARVELPAPGLEASGPKRPRTVSSGAHAAFPLGCGVAKHLAPVR